MNDDLPIRVLHETEAYARARRGGAKPVKFTLDLYGGKVNLAIETTADRVTLADIVPAARTLSSIITAAACRSVQLQGRKIACHKGCSACCNYLVPLSVPEAFRLRQEIKAMPMVRRAVIEQACLTAAKKIVDKPPPALFGEPTDIKPADSPAELLNVASKWYANFKLPCAFLCKSVCTIYEERPLACREYWVTGKAQACAGAAGEPEGIFIPVRMSEILGRLTAELEDAGIEGIVMPLAPIWAEENQQRGKRTWSADAIIAKFVEITQNEISRGNVEMGTAG
ncbi:MAG: YkgJ family cysteine cluster protein [Sedimentisphaerales bacterium]|nr:YkgJ family cysteine cluster protein [Sedimentisphaerales bacterium]